MVIVNNGFSLDEFKFDANHNLVSFDLFFYHSFVGHFESPEPKPANITNQDFTLWKHNVPEWVFTMFEDYQDRYHHLIPQDDLSFGFKALLRNLFEFFDVVVTAYGDPNIKFLCYGFKNRELVYLLSDHVISRSTNEYHRFSNSFSRLTGGILAGDYFVGNDIAYCHNLKLEVAFLLKFKRLSLNLTLADVVSQANKKGIQITTASLSRFENNLRHPDFETLAGLFNVLNLTDMNGFLDFFTDEFHDVLVDDEFDNFEFAPINITDAIPNNILLNQNESTLLSYLFVTFWGFLLDYKDNVWISLNELPIPQWIDSNDFKPILNSLASYGFIKTKSINDSTYVYLNMDAFIEDIAIAKIKALHSDSAFIKKYGNNI